MNESPVFIPLLFEGHSSNDEDDDSKISVESLTVTNGRHRNRHVCHRRSRKLTRMIIITGGVLFLFLNYTSLVNNIHCRLGMGVCIQINLNSSVMSKSQDASVPGWEFNTSRNTYDYILPDVDTTVIAPRNVCNKKFFLLIVVCSSVENFAARQTIRETWGNVSEFNYPQFSKMHSNLSGRYLDINEFSLKMYADHLNLTNITNFNESNHERKFPVNVVFLIGKVSEDKNNTNETLARIKLESNQYNDIIQEDFQDTYNNLTIKSLMVLKWVTRNCLNRAKFLMKCDDDTFINIPNILHILLGGTVPVYKSTLEFYDSSTVNALSPSNRLISNQDLLTGYLICRDKPITDTSSKWYSPKYMYNGDTYPNFLSGSSYLMSFDVIPKLFNSSLNTSLLHLEDVYLTGICAEKIHLRRRHHPLFSNIYSQIKCTYKGIVSQHYLKEDRMSDAYNFVINHTSYCPPPGIYFGRRIPSFNSCK